MLEAGTDYELRCQLIGHAKPRPDYGGGSITFRRDQLLKIAHPYEEGLFDCVVERSMRT
ncbi:hypothetical protein [Hyphococcus luteus]|uniref:hypothetical protein n=1 Tax=Hyphococcus luteus TaxID=2058213 RepID=UPI001A9CB1F3|nr:hypothetical protein [Marinicaulis flavus]